MFDELLALLLPSRCPGCGARAESVCNECAGRMRAAPLAPPPPGVTWWTACYAYEGVARELVARAKYRNERRSLRGIVPHLVDAIRRAPGPVDLVTWAPASTARLRAHGVDHAEVLARAIATEMRRPVLRTLERLPGPAQTGLDSQARRRGPRVRTVAEVGARRILVVDDVATTGGTLGAVARALRAAGAAEVFAATIARTPGPGDPLRTRTYTDGAWMSSSSGSTQTSIRRSKR